MATLITRTELEAKSDLDWFDTMCNILLKVNTPTVHKLVQLLGKEDLSQKIIEAKAVAPFDLRFDHISIIPDLPANSFDRPIDRLVFSGDRFYLKMADIIYRFPKYMETYNTYAGGIQAFFYPVPDIFEFSGIAFHTYDSVIDTTTYFHGVEFYFGTELSQSRVGFHLNRKPSSS
jgi:hypothetical protein